MYPVRKSLKRKIIALLFLYAIAFGIAEVSIAYYSLYQGLFIHAAIILLLIILSSYVQEKRASMFLGSLALLPALRVLAVSVPLITFLTPLYMYMLLYLPLLLLSYLFIRSYKMRVKDVGITIRKYKPQILIGLTGIIFGVMEYFILAEQIAPSGVTNLSVIISQSLIMLVFVGFTEELIFRGILLSSMVKIFSENRSIVFTSILFMVMHMGWHSQPDLLFTFAVSLFYSYVFIKTRSIVGITVSHGLTNILEFIIIPLLLL